MVKWCKTDDLDQVEIELGLELEFPVSIEDGETDGVKTLADVVLAVERVSP